MFLPRCFFVFVLVGPSSTTIRPRGKPRSVLEPQPMFDLIRGIETPLTERFGEPFRADAAPAIADSPGWPCIACRSYNARGVVRELARLLCACALSAPTKSDLQQSDILIIREKAKRHAIGALRPEMPWLVDAPVFGIFLGSATPEYFGAALGLIGGQCAANTRRRNGPTWAPSWQSKVQSALTPRGGYCGLYSLRFVFAILTSDSAALRSSTRKAANSAGVVGAGTTAWSSR